MASYAFVTILTSDSYLPGSLVTARSIKDAEKTSSREFDLVCLVTLDSVSVQSIKALRNAYDVVISVEEIRSENSQHQLNLLGRQDLSSTITKIHIWRLEHYQKVIYLDSDTLLLKPMSHLFESAQPFSACADIGWPDCFNSGLMVIKPSKETFDKIFEHFRSHGSWDGGDQGLLNDFFQSSTEKSAPDDSHPSESEGWNRLSFIYNVTPSAYYTYAPAYKRYGDKISMIHFIGSEKPWHLINRRRYRNAYFPHQQSRFLDAVDYDSLVDRWLDVYEKVVGPLEPMEYATIEPEFKVPKYLSQWDSEQPSLYKPPTFEELKDTFSRKKTSVEPVSDTVKLVARESGYMSLPFLNLSRIMHDHAQNNRRIGFTEPDPPLEPVKTEGIVAPSVEHPSEETHEKHQGYQQSHSVWDASRSSPPNQGYQMNQPVSWHYDSVWDKPLHEQSHYLFQPPATSHIIPPITHQDYSQFTIAPQPEAVKPIFPWEDSPRPLSGRVFPPEETHVSKSSVESPSSPSEHTAHQDGQSWRSAPSAISQANLSQIYRNVWDEDPGIGRWAKARSFSGAIKASSLGWERFQDKKAALIQTPRLEIKSFMGDRSEETESIPPKEATEDRNPMLNQPRHHSLPRSFSSMSYRSTGGSEDSSQDADEEDVGEDDDQTSDNRNPTDEDGSSETTITTPTEALDPLRSSSQPGKAQQSEDNGARGTLDSIRRLPTSRSVIVGIPVPMIRSSSSSSSSSGDGHRFDNGNEGDLVRTTPLTG